jgi:hypothetical protein
MFRLRNWNYSFFPARGCRNVASPGLNNFTLKHFSRTPLVGCQRLFRRRLNRKSPPLTRAFSTVKDEIWNMAVREAESLGFKNVADMIAGFRRADMLADIATFKNLMVCFASETVAQQIAP